MNADVSYRDTMLITADALADLLGCNACLVFDCRFDLKDPAAGHASWLAAHIPGAVYAHLDHDLAGPVTAASGRHPLPDAGAFAKFLAQSGWQPGWPVVAYDASGGAIAARLWWLMKYFGLQQVMLLDGGYDAWLAAGLPVASGAESTTPQPVTRLTAQEDMVWNHEAVAAALQRREIVLLDARAGDRFAGQNETIDPVAGHVPGAVNRPFGQNLAADQRFRPADHLCAAFLKLSDNQGAAHVVHMCGSGVTACHNLFAMELAGIKGSRLYAGSWSEWIRDPARPVAVGSD